MRTFTLVGLASGLAGLAGQLGQPFAAGALVAGSVAVLAVGYANRPGHQAQARRDDPDRRADHRRPRLHRRVRPAGLRDRRRAVVTLILALKAELHGFLDKLDEDDVKALARYAVIAGAVLPFLPNGHYGPLGAWNPQKLWLVVVLVTGFSFLGYVANRIFGERHGTIATALIGGAYSSTAVTQSLAQRLGSEQQGGAENAGIALATAVMYLRVVAPDRRPRRRACCSRSRSSCRRCVDRLGRWLLALPQGAQVRRAELRPAIRSRCLPAFGFVALRRGSPRSPRNGPRAASASRELRCCC